MALTATEKRLLNSATPGLRTSRLGDKIDALMEAAQPATEEKAGIVKMAAAVAEASGETVSAEQFNQLLAALKSAGIMATEILHD